MSEIDFSNPCSGYTDVDYDDEHFVPCSCPVCKAFISGNIFQDPLICKKCGSELVAIEASEKLKESDEWNGEAGHICVVTRREPVYPKGDELKTRKRVKEGWTKWKGFL